MKKQMILGTLIAATALQATVPAYASKESAGEIIGGIIGGVIGSKIGKGNGNTAAIIIGTIIGSKVGSDVGRDMDEADRRAYADAQQRVLDRQVGYTESWEGRRYGSRTGAKGSFTTTREGYNYSTGETCREYRSVIYFSNRKEETRGYACTRRDGTWYEVRETEVNFSGRDEGFAGGVRPGNPGRPGRPDRPGRFPRPDVPPARPVPPPIRSEYDSQVSIYGITRRTAGEWHRVSLSYPLVLSRIEVAVMASRVKIHEVSVVTNRGQRISVRELTNVPTIQRGDIAISENLNLNERIIAVDLRMESMGAPSDVRVRVVSPDQTPVLSTQRY